ncbi:MFS transporter [Candidatus Poriferisodalis sp.]|uniref:MFS transporter n=1 Tax=Candidatus Poriferisodalis sp. TaxID=3101277 RepID=UPI003B01F219
MSATTHAAGFSSARRIGVLLTLAAAAAVSQSFGRFTYSLLFTDLRDGFRLSNTAAGALGSLNLLMYLVGSLAVALTVGRTGLSGAVRIGVAGNVVGLALLAWSPNVGIAAFALAVTGFCAAGVWVGTPGLAAELLGPERRGAAAGWLTGGVGCGMVTAAALDAFLPSSGGPVLSDTASSEAALADASRSHLRDVYLIEFLLGAAVLVVLAVAVRRWARTPGRTGFGGARAALAKVPHAGRLVTAYALHAFIVSTVLTFIVGHLEGYADIFTAWGAELAFLSIGLGCIVGGPVFGRWADRFGRRRAVTIGFGVSLITIITSTAYPLLVFAGPLLAWVSAIAFGMAFSGIIASIAARVSDSLAGDEFGAAYGLATILFGLGLAAGPPVGGTLADWFDSFGPAFGLAGAACVLSVALIGWGDDPARRSDAETSA